MTSEETRCFKLLDKYSRSRHACYVAEMFFQEETNSYFICFQPCKGYGPALKPAGRYLEIGIGEIRGMASSKVLTENVAQWMDTELPKLGPR